MDSEGIITIVGDKPGKILTVIAGVHGDEPCGVAALETIIPEIRIDFGKVNFIYGNPRAINLGVHETQINLNRIFKPEEALNAEERGSYERDRALQLMPFLNESYAILDIHSSPIKNTTPFIVCERASADIARRMPFPIRSHGWDDIEFGSIDYYINQRGGFGLGIECGYNLDPNAVKTAQDAIMTFLRVMGAVEGGVPQEVKQRVIHAYYVHNTKTNFKIAREFADFELLKKGELIGHDGDLEITSPSDGNLILFCQNRDVPNKEAFILGKEE